MKFKRILLIGSVAMLLMFTGCGDKGQNDAQPNDKSNTNNVSSEKTDDVNSEKTDNADSDKTDDANSDNTDNTNKDKAEQSDTDTVVVERNSADRLNPQSGGADAEATALRESVMNAKDKLNTKGKTVYYISALNGDDTNDGKSEKTAWKTLSAYSKNKSKIKAGDVVLLERGGVYRGSIKLVSGVSYGAYGTGSKPSVWGSKKSYSGKGSWLATDIKNVWMCSDYLVKDVGTIVFNHGQAAGIRRYDEWDTLAENLSALANNFEFFYDSGDGRLYLYLEKDPSTVFYDIEICEKEHIIQGSMDCTDVTIDNLSIKYSGAHGVSIGNGAKNITITNCEMGWIGGSFMNETTRYGNAIEFWTGCSDILVENNWIYQIYDTGITHQGSDNEGVVQENITVRGNLVEYCTWGLEFWAGNHGKDTWRNILYENNIVRFSGYGWGMVRPDQNRYASVCAWEEDTLWNVKNFVIRNNIFDVSKTYLIMQTFPKNIDIKYTGNTYYQRAGVAALWMDREKLQATTQEIFEASIKKIDPEAKLVKLIQ